MAKSVRSYAQNGEDLICAMLLGKRDNVSYVDIGCLWPVEHSNTYFFYERGGHGLCIDPNPSVRAMFEEHRPRDVFVNSGVGDQAGELTYHRYVNPVYNTFSVERVRELEFKKKDGCRLLDSLPIPVRPLADILAAAWKQPGVNGALDLLSIDTEGYEDRILRTIDFAAFRPALIIFEHIVREAHRVNAYQVPLVRHLNDAGYDLVGLTGQVMYKRRR